MTALHHPGNLRAAQARQRAGDFAGAEQIYRSMLEREPDNAEALHALGSLRLLQGDAGSARPLLSRAVEVAPTSPQFRSSLADALRQLGRRGDAIGHLQAAAAAAPNDVVILNNMGMLQHEHGNLGAAIDALRSAAASSPGFFEAWYNLGRALRDAGQLADAENSFRTALAIRPNESDACASLATVLLEASRFTDACALLAQAARRDRKNPVRWQAYAHAMAFRSEFPEPDLEQNLLACMAADGIDLQGLDLAWVAWCHRDPAMTHLIQVARDNGESLGETLACGALAADLARPVVTGFLRNALITDGGIEDFFVRVRRALLTLTLNDRQRCPGGAATLDFLCALAEQCFLDEYLWDCGDAEQQSASELKRRVEEDLGHGRADPWHLALLACYLPLGDIEADADALAAAAPVVAALLRRQIVAPRRELALRENIAQLSPVVDPASHAVQRQYEENPYPRWLHLHRPSPDTLDSRLHRLFPHAFAQGEALPQAPDMLIAGCGTGRHAIQTALAYDGARVLAIDLSRASLAYATRRAEEYQCPRVRFAQADLIEVKDLGQQFDAIESIGVLHHLEHPLRGLRALSRWLKPGGFIKLGLYSRLARAHIAQARELLRAQGVEASKPGLKRARQLIRALPDSHPAATVKWSHDFYSASACRDLLFHARECDFDLKEVAQLLDRAGLEFVGFDLPDPSTAARYRQRFPADPNAVSLKLWHEFEQKHPHTFASMYVFWARKPRKAGLMPSLRQKFRKLFGAG